MIKFDENQLWFILPVIIIRLDALKWIEKIIWENAFEQKKKKLRLKFNPGLALIGLWTTGQRIYRNNLQKHL